MGSEFCFAELPCCRNRMRGGAGYSLGKCVKSGSAYSHHTCRDVYDCCLGQQRWPDAVGEPHADRSLGFSFHAALDSDLDGAARACPGSPCPLEVVSAKPSCYVNDFADEVEAGHLATLHGLCIELCSVDAASRYLGLCVALGSGGS